MDNSEIVALAREVIDRESAAISLLTGQVNQSLVTAARRLLDCQGHILVTGSGTSHTVGARLAHLLSSCGTPALFIHAGDSQPGLAGAITKKDVLIAISKGGETLEVNHLARIAKNRGAGLIALTEKPDSTLGKLSDTILQVVAPPGIDPYGMVATGSSLVNMAFCDALCVVMLHLRGTTREQFGQAHLDGAVDAKTHVGSHVGK